MQSAAWLPVAFEVVLLVGALAVLAIAVVAGRDRRFWAPVAGLAFAGASVVGILQWRSVGNAGSGLFFSAPDISIAKSPMVVMDGLSSLGAVALGLVGLVGFLAAWDLVVKVGRRGPELVSLLLLALAGLHMMMASPNLIVIFLGLETASISFYVVAAFLRRDARSEESGLKYFLLGSLASALFLYGIALMFAATGSLTLYGANSIRDFFSTTVVTEPGILLAGMALMLVGIGFKVSAAPFHQWAPDVYQGAPTGAVGFMAATVKIAGFAALARIFAAGLVSQIDSWSPIVAILAALSMVIGTVLALVQSDVKRMLAYSGVAHAGYILTAMTAGVGGVPAMWFYVTTYAFMVVGGFAVLSAVSGAASPSIPIDDLKGLAKRSPELGWLMTIVVLGMSGMPFFAGFVGKLYSFVTATAVSAPWPMGDHGYLWLVVLGVVMSVVGLAFYFRIIGTIFAAPENDLELPEAGLPLRFAVIVSAAITVVFGIVPWPLIETVRDALPL